jgi:lipopolysaccharide/colanic/teichoic acid biosynthesis glycosyltransferase
MTERKKLPQGPQSTSRTLLAGAFRSGSLWTFATVPAAPESQKVRARNEPRWHQHVVAQELFKDVLTRERTRADRFDQPFVLLLVEVDTVARKPGSAGDVPEDPTSIWMHAIEALTVAAGGTAVLGWFEKQTVLGAIVPHMIFGCDIETLARRELANRLDAETVARLSIRSHVYSPFGRQPEGWREADSFLLHEHSPGQRRPAQYRIKRSLDFAGTLTLLLILSPILLLIAALVKLTSPGPILFRQSRVGQMAKPFTMLKFRTMRVNADHALHHEFVTKFIRSSAQLHPASRRALFKLRNDPRVTPLGRRLRKTSLDELPQLWNVFRGDMSLVGPRPPLAYEVEQYRPWHWRRVLDAKPGLTGLWQVSGRSRTTFDEMVRLDLRYVRTCSLWTDIKILLATPRAVISGKGAG